MKIDLWYTFSDYLHGRRLGLGFGAIEPGSHWTCAFQSIPNCCVSQREHAGRKTDVRDCEWIEDLPSHGLLKGSFIPPEPTRDKRDLTRYRKSLIDERTREIHRSQKLLESANLNLSSVATDIMGVSGKAMLEGILSGSADPEVLSDLANGRLRRNLPLPREALQGCFRPHHRFLHHEWGGGSL